MLNFPSPASGQKLTWKRPSQALVLECMGPDETAIASLDFGRSTKPCGKLEIFDAEMAKGGKLLEEVMISGMAYIHLSRYMRNYAGGSSTIGTD